MTAVAEDLLARLRIRYAAPEWVLLSEVRNAAGQSASRTADAVAMNMWPSRGLAVHGFEIKASRGDWLRELKDPSKAEAIARFCDFWWLVVPEANVVESGELPKGWGVLVVRGKGLHATHEAVQMEALEPINRSFAAAMLRRAQQEVSADGELRGEYRRGYNDGHQRGKENAEAKSRMEGASLEQLRAVTDAFEEEVGFPIYGWRAPTGLAETVKMVIEGRVGEHLANIERIHQIARRVVKITKPPDDD